MTIKLIQTKKTTLAYGISDSATTMRLTNLLKLDGTAISASSIGDVLYGTFDPGTSREEIFSIASGNVTVNSDGTVDITSVVRGLQEVDPYSTGGFATDHPAGAVVVFGNNPQVYDKFGRKADANTWAALNTFTLLPKSDGGNATDDTQLVTYAQALAMATGTTSINRIVVAGNGGEVITAGQLLYLLVTDGEWYKCDADTAATVDNIILGIAQGAGTDGGAITNGVLLFGLDSNQTGLTTNTAYYASNTAGSISSSVGTVEVSVGISRSTTSLLFYPRYNQQLTENQQDALVGSSGTPSASNKYLTEDDVSSAGGSGKIVRLSSTSYPAGDGSALTNIVASPVLTGVASGENISAYKPVYINPNDSSMYTSHGWLLSTSTAENITSTTSDKLAKLSDTLGMYLTDNGTTTLTINVYNVVLGTSIASQTVTTAFDQTTSSTPTLPSATMCRLSDTTFIVFYGKTTDNAFYFRTGSISGATITMDTETAYSGSPTYCFGMEATPGASDGKVVLSYFDGAGEPGAGGTWNMVLSYLTCSTNTATVTYTTSYSQASGTYNANAVWSRVAFTRGIAYGLFCAVNSNNDRVIKYNYIDTVSGTTSNGNYTLSLETPTGTGVPSTYSQYMPFIVGHNGNIYFGWATYDGGTNMDTNVKTVLEASTSGCKIVYQSTCILLAGDTAISALKMFGNEMGVIVTGFNQATNGSSRIGSIYIQKDKIYGFLLGNVSNITTNDVQAQANYSNLKDEVVIAFIDGGGGGFETWKLPTPIDGFVISGITAPATGTIYTSSATLSGLTANAKYYLKDTYSSVGDMANTGTIPVGDALSTTVMKITPSY